ncbi:MAG: hypothetical protein NC308_09995 [Clostridium sp.]|nr:hypothetical protein [Bacteroides sp.]MCM1199206.1 hypothetical protein [Clostridium sp.]
MISDGKIYTYDVSLCGGVDFMASDIYQMSDNGRTYYLIKFYGKEAAAWAYNSVSAFELVDGCLKNSLIFENFRSESVHYIEVEYNIPDWSFIVNCDGWHDWIYYFDSSKKLLYEPVQAVVSLFDRYTVFKWNGKMMEVVDNDAANPFLHKDLHGYRCLKKLMTAGKFLVRVDELVDGRLRYASWERHNTMSDKPDLVLFADSQRETDIFRFVNKEYMYEVTDDDMSTLNVYKAGKLIYSARQAYLDQ